MSEINFCNTKEQLNHLGEVVTGKTNGSPSGAPISTSTLPYTGQVRNTLPALEAQYQGDIDNFNTTADQVITDKTAEFDASIASKEAAADSAIDAYRLLSKGPYASGITLDDKFEYITYNGESYFATNPPYTTTATAPDVDGNLFAGGYLATEQLGSFTNYQALSINDMVSGLTLGNQVIPLEAGQVWTVRGRWMHNGGNSGTLADFDNLSGCIYVEDFGVKVDNSAEQNTAGMNKIFNEAPRYPDTGTAQSLGRVVFDVGTYDFKDKWELKVHAIFEGVSSGHNGVQPWTRLRFSGEDGDAITVNRFNTLDGEIESTPTGRADGTVFKGLSITSRNKVAFKNGIWLRARAKLEDCHITNFGGWGFRIVASAVTSAPDILGNANNWVVDGMVIGGCGTAGQHPTGGMYIDGADVNIGSAKDLDISSNYGYGLYDSSFLGNTYIACHFATNGRAEGDNSSQVYHLGNRYYLVDNTESIGSTTEPGTDNNVWRLYGAGGAGTTYPQWINTAEYSVGLAVLTDNANARNEFFGCYTEGGQPRCKLQAPDQVHGGIMSGGGVDFDEDSNHLNIAASTAGSMVLNNQGVTNTQYGHYRQVLGAGAKDGRLLSFTVDGGHAGGFSFDIDSGGERVGWSFANGSIDHGIYTDTATETAGRSETVRRNTIFFPGVLLGSGDTLRHFGRATWTTGSAFPTSGEFARGDTFFFSGAASGGKVGCYCSTGGTAGSTAVFKYFGTIDA